MGQFYKLEDMLCEELEKIESQGRLSANSLEIGDKAAHFLKSIKTIEAMEDGGYSYDYSREGGNSNEGNSYARGRGRNARRDSMGRYRDNEKQSLMMELDELKNKIEGMN